ncbi:NACHT domain-containing protein [Acinetobacter sp.]|uniref:NACHT domain-containing protein n=1 Tax=Acinetobacter sp. TaxID=472 RepID=UPI003340B68B
MELFTSEVTTVVATATVRSVTNETIKEVIQQIKKKFSNKVITKNISIDNEDLIASVSKLMLVKTLFTGADKPVNLFDFFQNPKLKYNDEIYIIDTIKEIYDDSKINNCKNFILRGTVGQGKSILMRYLAINDLVNNSKIPIFIELKNISKTKNISLLINEQLSSWIGNNNDELINILLRSGKISIYLDAFDEIDSDFLQQSYGEINNLCQSYKDLVVVVSSRPETIITQSALFEIIDLLPYTIDEQEGLIEKLVEDNENKKILIESIKNSTHEVKSVLTTPLMVVLFIKQYTVGFSVPQHVSDFYKNIFDVVTFTHDRSKGIEKRKSYSSLNQEQLEIIFERFCFETFLVERTVFDKQEFIKLLRKSIEKNNILNFTDFNNLIFDYTRFACLILQDGNEYTFIHKSIQEFYVAKFIENLPENLAEKVIDVKLNDSLQTTNYLEFLKILKPYFYNKFYILKGLVNYQDVLGLKFIDNDENYNLFIETLYVWKGAFSSGGKYLGVRYVSSGFATISQTILFEMLTGLKNKELLEDGVIFWLNEDEISNETGETDSNNKPQLLTLYDRESLNNIDEIRNAWTKLCSCYDNYLQKVQCIENSVSMDDLEI